MNVPAAGLLVKWVLAPLTAELRHLQHNPWANNGSNPFHFAITTWRAPARGSPGRAARNRALPKRSPQGLSSRWQPIVFT